MHVCRPMQKIIVLWKCSRKKGTTILKLKSKCKQVKTNRKEPNVVFQPYLYFIFQYRACATIEIYRPRVNEVYWLRNSSANFDFFQVTLSNMFSFASSVVQNHSSFCTRNSLSFALQLSVQLCLQYVGRHVYIVLYIEKDYR